MNYHTDMERKANEAFDRAMLGGSTIYVNGIEWKPGQPVPETVAKLEIATEQQQDDFWGNLPDVIKIGIKPVFRPTRLAPYVAASLMGMALIGLLAWGMVEFVKRVL